MKKLFYVSGGACCYKGWKFWLRLFPCPMENEKKVPRRMLKTKKGGITPCVGCSRCRTHVPYRAE